MGRAVLLVIGFIVVLAGLQFLILKLTKKFTFRIDKRVRIGMFAISLILLIAIFVKPNYYNEHVLKYVETQSHNFNPLKRARSDGYIPTLMHTVKPTYMDKPEAYSKNKVQDITKKYNKLSKEINKDRDKSIRDSQTILYLSESLMDPKRVPNLLLNETSIPFITKTSEDNIGGTMYSQYIGGGTANIEWSVLTSFSLETFREPIAITPYSDFYEGSRNHNTVLSLFDDKKVAVHPYSAHLYKRKTIYNKIGFDQFLFLNNGIQHTEKQGTHKRVSDEALNKDIFRVANQKDVDLIHVLSMQNHSPYGEEIPDMEYKPEINTKVYLKKKEKGLINYLQGTKASDEAVKDLIQKLDKSDKEVNLLFYGDHFPSLFRGEEDKYEDNTIYETPLFIYINNGRSEQEIEYDGISPSFFIPVLLKEGNYYVTPYQGMLNELLDKGVKRVGRTYVVTKKGELKDNELPKELLEIVQDYRMIQYDALFGHNWLGDDFFTEIR